MCLALNSIFNNPKSVFGSVVAGAFQITFHAEMHANDVFLFFKNHFWHQHIKTIQKVQTPLNFSKKKKIQIFTKHRKKRTTKRSLNALERLARAPWFFVGLIFQFLLFFI